jgi:hypothetical protein
MAFGFRGDLRFQLSTIAILQDASEGYLICHADHFPANFVAILQQPRRFTFEMISVEVNPAKDVNAPLILFLDSVPIETKSDGHSPASLGGWRRLSPQIYTLRLD